MNENLEFILRPGEPSIRTVRETAIISLHTAATNYLTQLNPNVRPIELPLFRLEKYNGVLDRFYFFPPNKDLKESLTNFALNFQNQYPFVEQVYALSRSCSNKYPDPPFSFEGSVLGIIDESLASIIHKRTLVLPCFGDKQGTYRFYQDTSSNEIIMKTIESSLRFSSW